jgi:hypothetical protein
MSIEIVLPSEKITPFILNSRQRPLVVNENNLSIFHYASTTIVSKNKFM